MYCVHRVYTVHCTQSLFLLINGNERHGNANALHEANRRLTSNFSAGERSWEPVYTNLLNFPIFRNSRKNSQVGGVFRALQHVLGKLSLYLLFDILMLLVYKISSASIS